MSGDNKNSNSCAFPAALNSDDFEFDERTYLIKKAIGLLATAESGWQG